MYRMINGTIKSLVLNSYVLPGGYACAGSKSEAEVVEAQAIGRAFQQVFKEIKCV